MPERIGNRSRKISKIKMSKKPPEKGGLKSSKHGGHALQKRSFAVLTARKSACAFSIVRGCLPLRPRKKGDMMRDKIKRTMNVQVRLTEEEFDYLNHKFELSGLKSKSEFMRMLFFEGLIVKFNDDDMQYLMRQIGGMTSNINQIATRVNSTNKIYANDIEEIKQKQEEIWQQLKYLESQLQLVRQ